jgi:glycosyltransferase involved in cell wall biosynthesis
MRTLNILHVNTTDHGGGAAQLAYDLLEGSNSAGHQAWLAVLKKTRLNPRVYTIANDAYRSSWERFCYINLRALTGSRIARTVGRPISSARVLLGHEDFDFPGSSHLLEITPELPDIVHLHNLHGGFFDLRVLPELSSRIPTFLTLHDAWLTSGHCSHSFDCDRWRKGCGACPDLNIYPAIRRDATAYNWKRKHSIYKQSQLHIAVPCRWLMDKLQASILAPAIASATIIPHGIDLTVFHPGDRASARRKLGWSVDADILIFSAKGIRGNVAKDYQTMRAALEILGERPSSKSLLFIALGDDAPEEMIGNAKLRFVSHLSDRAAVASHYQAADIYVHGARAEVWGLSITEAMACGLPVVASDVGGIPDQVEEAHGGFLVPPGDATVMADRIRQLLDDSQLRTEMGRAAGLRARAQFGVQHMTLNYLNWYERVLHTRDLGRQAALQIMPHS